jgi:hypothetical protein
MSRIYSAETSGHDVHVVIKTTDCSRGLGTHEYDCYSLLSAKGFDIPEIQYVAKYGDLLFMIMSRYKLSLASLLLTIASRNSRGDAALLEHIIDHVCHLLHALKESNIAYCDFTPDNIMVSIDRETLQGKLILIDPQFVLPMSHLTSKIGRHWAENIDRVHFAYKTRILALQDPRLSSISNKICLKFLGYIPSESVTKKWVLEVLPLGLRIAYDCIHKESKKLPSERYATTKGQQKSGEQGEARKSE